MSAKCNIQVTIVQSTMVRPRSCKARYTDARSAIHEPQLRLLGITAQLMTPLRQPSMHSFAAREVKSPHSLLQLMYIHCVSKNDSDVAHYNFTAHQPILVIFGRDIAERICY